MIIGYSSKIQGLFWPFSAVSIVGRYSPIQLELARFNANRLESKPRRRESWKKKKHVVGCGPMQHRHVGSGVPYASPCRT